MFIIVSGVVAVTSGRGGERRVLATRSQGDVVGEMAVITSEPRIADLVCDGPSACCRSIGRASRRSCENGPRPPRRDPRAVSAIGRRWGRSDGRCRRNRDHDRVDRVTFSDRVLRSSPSRSIREAAAAASVTRISPGPAWAATWARDVDRISQGRGSRSLPLETTPTNAVPVCTRRRVAATGRHRPRARSRPAGAPPRAPPRRRDPSPAVSGMKKPTTSSPTNFSTIASSARSVSVATL